MDWSKYHKLLISFAALAFSNHTIGHCEPGVIYFPLLSSSFTQTLDQGLFAPVILFGFMNFVGILRREDITFRWLDIKANYPDILVNNYKFWPIIQLFNFYVVPLQHRLMVVNLAALCWNTYLSWRTNQNIPEARVKELLPDVDVGYWAESHHRDNDGTYWVKK